MRHGLYCQIEVIEYFLNILLQTIRFKSISVLMISEMVLHADVIEAFSATYTYLDDFLYINNPELG